MTGAELKNVVKTVIVYLVSITNQNFLRNYIKNSLNYMKNKGGEIMTGEEKAVLVQHVVEFFGRSRTGVTVSMVSRVV